MNLFIANDFLSSLACHSNDCLSWMIIVINILTVSYLVFCSFFKFGKTLKIIGFIWLVLALAGIVTLIILHTCVFTIICAVFTILILITAFAVILTHQQEETINNKKSYGYYVINPTTDGKFTFSFYDKHKKLVLESGYYMNTLEELNSAIDICRERGIISKIEDHTKEKFLNNGYPKFEIHSEGKYYFYLFRCNSKTIVFNSKRYCSYKKCLKDATKLSKIIKSSKVYYSSEIKRNEGLSELKSKYVKEFTII